MVTPAKGKSWGRDRPWKPRNLRSARHLRLFLVAPLAFAATLNSYGDPPPGPNPASPERKLPLGQPLSSWTACYGPPKSDNGKNAVFRAAITANPPELVIVVQSKAFGTTNNSPMTAALWK